MLLNQVTATEIIRRIENVIDFDLNIMDSTGLILASTDVKRINTYHEGAHIIIENGLDELIVEEDCTYDGCRKGVNLPIYFSTEIIGVIGITGQPAETIKYGRILQKMTELLIREYFETSQQNATERRQLVFLNNFLNGNLDIAFSDLEKWLQDNLIDPHGPFCVALLKYVDNMQIDLPTELLKANYDVIKKYIKNQLSASRILTVYSGGFFIIISNHSAIRLQASVSRLADELVSMYHLPLLCCIGNEYTNYLDIPKSYNEANTIFHYFDQKKQGIFLYSTIVLDFTINQIPVLHRRNLYNNVFSDCSAEEIKSFSDFIIYYFECNGSLNKLAEKLFIHKNTVQYKIQCIYKKTGFNLRVQQELFILYLAATYKV